LRLAGESRFKEAYELLLPLAERGERKAQYIVGESLYWGTGVAQDRQAAVKWYRKAADGGLPEAKFNLAHAYKNGSGVAPSRTRFEPLLSAAANAGFDKAQQDYSVLLRERKNYRLALKWALRAANQGLVAAQVNAGHMYRLGLGTDANDEEALLWLGIASSNYKPADQFARQLAQKLGPERTENVIKRLAAWTAVRELAPITSPERQ
jgi:TPR repeat protein